MVFLAFGLIFNLLLRSVRLNLIFQELFSAFKENIYGNYCLASELRCKLSRFVVVGETLQLRWGVGGGLHMGVNHLVFLVHVVPPASCLMLLNLLHRIRGSWCLKKSFGFFFSSGTT